MSSRKFNEYKGLDLPQLGREVLEVWDRENTFGRSITEREGAPAFIFYEGPPSANGLPGIHHVLSRTIKDTICRYKTQQGYLVRRKAGWDTHGLPVELGVEKKLGITKEDIGHKISIEEYNRTCREAVMEFTGVWEELTRKMGYWVDMKHPYITYENKYIETLWWMLKQLFDKGLLYKGYTIQPYSPAAGTGLSNHELNQPGCYRDVKDTTCTAQFEIIRDERSEFLFDDAQGTLYFLAWTTTPWTLPSNTALAVGDNIEYVRVKCLNPYTQQPQTVILAKELLPAYFTPKMEGTYSIGERIYKGSELVGIRYRQLIDWVKPMGDAFRVISGDYVTTVDGTGIDYPVVQGATNMDYVNRDVYGDFSLSGAIFLDSRCAADLTDPYTVIYGHHMDNSAMFGDVARFAEADYFAAHPAGSISLPDAAYTIELFACVVTDAYDTAIYTPERYPDDVGALLDYAAAQAVQQRDIGVTAQDRLVALSTCAGSETNGRVVVLGRLCPLKEGDEMQ